MKHIREVLKKRSSELRAKPHVVATGIGYKVTHGRRTSTLAIVCSVDKKVPAYALTEDDLVPEMLDEMVTDVVEVGRIRAFAAVPKESTTDRIRPAPGGVSIGHIAITAGTLGCLVRKGGQNFILSNAHVLANSGDAQLGDPILQPGPYDGGILGRDTIAALEDFVPINFENPEPPSDCPFASMVNWVLNLGCRLIGSKTRYRAVRPQAAENLVDAALARPLMSLDVVDSVLGIGSISGIAPGSVGMAVRKSGRTTGVTSGTILQTDVTAQVDYGGGRTALFVDQLLTGPMSQGGDSGSVVVDNANRFVGLVFAGSDAVTILNRSEHVLKAFGVTR